MISKRPSKDGDLESLVDTVATVCKRSDEQGQLVRKEGDVIQFIDKGVNFMLVVHH